MKQVSFGGRTTESNTLGKRTTESKAKISENDTTMSPKFDESKLMSTNS
jgi:hypothetical protein